MPVIDDDGFLKKYQIEFSAPSDLAVLHAESVSVIKGRGYNFSPDALDMIDELVAPSGLSPIQFNRWITSDDAPMHHEILFFLDRSYQMSQHIWAIRNSWDELALTS